MSPNILKSFVGLLILCSVSSFAQSNSKIGFGIVGGIAAYQGDFTNNEWGLQYPETYGEDYGFQIYLPVREHFSANFSYVYSKLYGDASIVGIIPSNSLSNFTTGMNKFGLSGGVHLWQLYEDRRWTPYSTLELDYFLYSPKFAPDPNDPTMLLPIYTATTTITQSSLGWAAEIGIKVVLANEFYLQLSTQYVSLFSDNLDGFEQDNNDSYQRLNLGIFYHFNRADTKSKGGNVRCYQF